MNKCTNEDRYVGRDYATKHPDWHAADAPFKAKDIDSAIQSVVHDWAATSQTDFFHLADVGAGVGLVIKEVEASLAVKHADLRIISTAYEISPHAAKTAKQNNPSMRIEERLLVAGEEQFDLVLMIDVLEHVENPWELLRIARSNSRYLVVRQPLLGNFSRFRHDDYRNQRDHWGHISCFNYRSFLDMACASGWCPLHLELMPPWQLFGERSGRPNLVKRYVAAKWSVMASFFIDGYYLIGAFKAS